ncbi:hypothetical protein [Nonomuraea africana]|uniref:AI-2E family transporter n=1 Tax=Nonomuraea africana TaxID=46171 RepID=A0ABR9K5R4_9ACTN|nr:hypothetical protein [Nonomuraea africana]MBE1557356.1 hypothetical protein [Nonomuraea africana]
MTNTQTTTTATLETPDTPETPHEVFGAAPHEKRGKAKKSKAKRRVAKGLAWFALLFTAVLVLAEPWLLVPVAAMLAAIALED